MTSRLNLCKDLILEFAFVRKGTFTVQPYPAEKSSDPFSLMSSARYATRSSLCAAASIKIWKTAPYTKITSSFKIPKRNFQGLSNTILFHLIHDKTKRTLTLLDYICMFIAHIKTFLTNYFKCNKREVLDLYCSYYIDERQNGKCCSLCGQPCITKS